VISPRGAGHHSQIGSGRVTSRPATLCCVNLDVESSGDYIEVYDGKDPISGTKILKIKCLENRSVSFNLTHGVYCDNGIYVGCSATDCEWSVFYHHIEVSPQHLDT